MKKKNVLGKYLRTCRENLNLTLREAAHKGACSAGYLCIVESGKTEPNKINVGLLVRLAKVYGVDLQNLTEKL
jgi:transcriptional regulator with XRE-family HTH domain